MLQWGADHAIDLQFIEPGRPGRTRTSSPFNGELVTSS